MPRAGLTPEVVVAEAAEVADEVGFDRLTLAAVADRFGVAVPSLYKHVDGLDGLRRGVAIKSIRELGDALAPATSLTEVATAYRGFAHSHPGRYAATLRAADPGDEEASAASGEVLATVLGVLEDYGLTGPDAIDATRALRSSLHGFVALEAVGGFGIPQDVDRSFDRMVASLDRALRA
ncbi:MAG TPA: TetR-like C-terminal domain-containing protein [Actinomycetota bacterium]